MKRLVILAYLATLAICPKLRAQTATVTWTTTYQTMDGFGGQTWTWADNLTPAQAQLFFSTTSGIGMEYVRSANTWNGSIPDLTTLTNATAIGGQIELGLQSPPCSIKYSGNELGKACNDPSPCVSSNPSTCGAFADGTANPSGAAVGTCLTNNNSMATNYTTWANYIVGYVNTLASSAGARVAIVDVDNEPDLYPLGSLGKCIMSPASLDAFVGQYLGPAFKNATWNSTQGTKPLLMLASQSAQFGSSDYVSPCLNDATCKPYLDIVAGHSAISIATSNFLGEGAISSFQSAGGHIWLSEADVYGTYSDNAFDTSCTDPGVGGLVLATNIHNYLTQQNISGYEYWELAYGWNENSGLTDNNFTTTCRYYMQGNWSKFVRPGWVRIDATANPSNGVYVTAFKETTSGNFAIVAINQNSGPVNVQFSFAGFPSVSSVTPTLTSASYKLEDQASVNISGQGFSYSLPGTSVSTFHGVPSSLNASKTPASPTNLAATVN